MRFEEALRALVSFFESYNYIPTVISIIINIFHVFILSRKTISASAVHCILLGMGIVDILSPLIYIKIAVNNALEPSFCKLPPTHLQVIIDWIFLAIRDDFRRCSVWFGLSLAIIRTLSLKMAAKKQFDFINESKTGKLSIVIIIFMSSLLSTCYIFRYRIAHIPEPWILDEGCPEIEQSLRYPFKIVEITGDTDSSKATVEGTARMIHLVLTAIFGKIIPSILFPISAVILVSELRKTRKLLRNYDKQADRTTRLVVQMTITFIIIELPIGICNLVLATRQGYDDAIIPESITKLLNMIYVSMTPAHCLICFILSSQYRKTVKNVLGFREKPIVSTGMLRCVSNS